MSKDIEPIKGFHVIHPDHKPKTSFWNRIPDGAWEVGGDLLVKAVGATVRSRLARALVVGLIAALTKAAREDTDPE